MIETTALNGMFILFSAIVCFTIWASTALYYKWRIRMMVDAHYKTLVNYVLEREEGR